MTRRLAAVLITGCMLLISRGAWSWGDNGLDESPVQVNPTADPMLKMAGEYLLDGQPDRARELIEKVLADQPDHEHARLIHAMALIELGEYEQGRAAFEAMIAENPDNYVILNNYAWLLATSEHRAFRNPKEALALAQEAILAEPDSYPVWSTLAEAHFVNGNFSRAVESMKNCYDLAVKVGAPDDTINKYRRQYAKMRDADKVMRLLE